MTSPSQPTPSAAEREALRAAMDRVRGTPGTSAGDGRKAASSEPIAPSTLNTQPSPRQFWDVRGRVADDLARVPVPHATTWPRPLAGLVAGLWSALMSWLVFAGVEITAWIFAPLGSGSFSDVLRGSGATWIIANGGEVRWQGAVLSLPPLLATLVIVLFQRRAGSWLIAAVNGFEPRATATPLLFAVMAAASAQAVAVAAVMNGSVAVPLWRSVLGAALVAAVGFGWGVSRTIVFTLAEVARSSVRVLQRFFLGLTAAAALLVIVAMIVKWRDFAAVLSAVAGDRTSALEVLLLCALFLPTAVGWASALLIGPGFTLGQGTIVSVAAVQLGPLPPIPLLALVPSAMPSRAGLLLLIPALIAVWATRAATPQDRWWVRALTIAGGAVAGVSLTLAVTGGIGPGRLTSVGVSAWQVGLACALWLLLGYSLHGLLSWLRRRMRARKVDETDAGKLPT